MNSRSNAKKKGATKSTISTKNQVSAVKFSSRKASKDASSALNNFDESKTEFQVTQRLNNHMDLLQSSNKLTNSQSKETNNDENMNGLNRIGASVGISRSKASLFSNTIRSEVQNLIQQAQQQTSIHGSILQQQSDVQSQQQNCLMDTRRKSKFMFPLEEDRSQGKIGCLLMMKQTNKIYNTNNNGNSDKNSLKASLLMSTAPQSINVMNRHGDNHCNGNKFFLILDDNEQESLDREVYCGMENEGGRISEISEIPSHLVNLQEQTYFNNDDTSSLIEIIQNPDAKLKLSTMNGLEINSLMNSTTTTTLSTLIDYGQTVKAQNVYQSIKPKGFCPPLKEPIKLSSQLPPQSQGDNQYFCDITNNTTMMVSPAASLGQKLLLFKTNESKEPSRVMKNLNNNRL